MISNGISIAITGDIVESGPPPVVEWILEDGTWNDSGVWVDSDTWNDGINAIYSTATAGWPLTESDNHMKREVLGSGYDLFPQNITLSGGYARFTGSNSYMGGDGSGIALSTNTSFTLTFTLEPSASTGTRYIMYKGNGPFPAYGEWVISQVSTAMRFRLFGTNGTDYTDISGTLTNGVANVVTVGYDSATQKISMKINSGSVSVQNHTHGTRNSDGSLKVGLTYIGGMKDIIFWKGTYLSSTDQATNYTELTTNGYPWSTLSDVSYTLDPDDETGKVCRIRFSDLSTQWQDTAKTTPVENDNEPIGIIDSIWGSMYAEAPSDAERPISEFSTLNGGATARSNGVDTRMNLSQRLQTVAADYYCVVIAKNEKTPTGSHWLSNQGNYATATNSYITQTSAAYSAPSGYLAAHMSASGSGYAPNSGSINNPNGFNILEIFCISTIFEVVENGDGPSGTTIIRGANLNPADWDTLFKDAHINDWWALGNMAEFFFIEKTTTVAERSRIRKFLELEYGGAISNVGYYGY